jgi:hypothetical protein
VPSEADAHAAKRSRRPVPTDSMVDQVGKAIACEVNFESDRPRYRKLSLAVLRPLARSTEASSRSSLIIRSGTVNGGSGARTVHSPRNRRPNTAPVNDSDKGIDCICKMPRLWPSSV